MSEPLVSAEHDAIELAAAEWLMRLQDPDVSVEELAEWQHWMRLDARHAQAFDGLESMWERFEVVAVPADPSERALARDRYDGSVPVGEWLTMRGSPEAPLSPRLFAAAACAVLACAALAGGALYRSGAPRNELARQTIETGVGENRSITLADGSSVKLGGRSRLSFSLRANVRDLELEQGEAFFAVAKDPTRPFQVHAGSATVTAVGTEFDVHRSDDRVTVSVVEGRVMVQPMVPLMPVSWLPPSRPVGRAAPLSAGERTVVNRQGLESTPPASIASALEWQDGRLAFEGESLRYVVQDVNRYNSKPIVIADRHTAELRVTGTIASDNVLGWVHSLRGALGVRADVQPDRIVLYKE